MQDTIVAVATAAGPSPRAIVRMSGPRAVELLRQILARPCPSRIPDRSYRAFSADVLVQDTRVPVRIYLMRSPASYTRQDIVELHTFGSPPLLAGLLEELTRRGARSAEPGEFTRRAFLNGRLDLAQAEAVQALIHARSQAEFRSAAAALSGRLSHRVRAIRDRLADLAALVELSLDFSDQDVDIISRDEIVTRLGPLHHEMADLLASGSDGRLPSQAVRAVLFGPPNAGKSSLFNAILKNRRAIVSPHPGTTRDTIEATVAFDEIELLLVDTAGLRPPDSEIEAQAVSRSRRSVRNADLALCVLDSSCPPTPQTHEAIEYAKTRPSFLLLNKRDLGPCNPLLRTALPGGLDALPVSTVTDTGLDHLLQRITQHVRLGLVDRSPGELMINARQADHLRAALRALGRVLEGRASPNAVDLVAADIRDALSALSQLSGEDVVEDVLDRVFANFCIGK